MSEEPLRIKIKEFDPFTFVQSFRWARNANTWWFSLLTICFAGILLIVTSIDGTVGGPRDLQPTEDFSRVFHIGHATASKPSFPLMRDLTSWLLALIIAATCLIIQRQWKLMAECLGGLANNGALKPQKVLKLDTRTSRMLRLDKQLAGCEKKPACALESLVESITNHTAPRMARWTAIVAFASVLLVILIILGEKHSIFQIFMPDGLSSVERNRWLSTAYANWWASDNHPLGFLAYFLIAYFAYYVVLTENIVGFVGAYLMVALPTVALLEADWVNGDGNYGWKPLSRVFRTVFLLLALHGFGISLLLVVLGIENFPWIIGLVLIWIVVVPLYILSVGRVFRRVQHDARERRITELEGFRIELDKVAVPENVVLIHGIADEIERVRKVRIRPVKVAIPRMFAFVGYLLPIILTIVQLLKSFGIT